MEKWYFEVTKGKTVGFFPSLHDGKYKIVEVKKMRSPEQNRLYWGYIIKFIVVMYKEAGYIHSKDYIHECFKKAFLEKEKVYSDWKADEYVLKIGSSTNLNTKQFSEFIGKIKIFCEHGVLSEIKGLESLDPFVIPDITDDELLEWVDKVI